ncbi:hypothetical protein NL676_033583 [Syzygium grande]|nr:hypothetical protein NL676_033583 [Syzygium grande]
MVNLSTYLKGREVADMVKLSIYLEVVDMKGEDKPWEDTVEEERRMEDKENVVTVGTYLEGWEVVNMVNLRTYLKGREVADMVKLSTYLDVVDMKGEDKLWEGTVEEKRRMEDRENVVEVGIPLDYVVDTMGT